MTGDSICDGVGQGGQKFQLCSRLVLTEVWGKQFYVIILPLILLILCCNTTVDITVMLWVT